MSTNVLKFVTREVFNNASPDLKFEDVLLPEFGEGAACRILELSAEAAQAFGEIVAKEEAKFAMPLWIIASARLVVPKLENGESVFETGGPLFEDTPETRAKLLSLGASIVMRLGNTALRLNGFTKTETEIETKN